MISTGTELKTFITNLNAGAAIDDDLLDVLVDNARTIFEEERSWAVLRKTDTSLTVATSDTWQTAKSLAGITDFNRFYGETPVKLADSSGRIHYYRQVPFEQRLEYRDIGGTFVYDASTGTIYLNGVPPFAGTLYINYIKTSGAIDLSSSSAVWTAFPSRFLPILGYYAIGINKGAIDYDDINRQMLPANAAVLGSLKSAAEKWDNELQLSAIEGTDPTEPAGGYPRSGAINRYGNS